LLIGAILVAILTVPGAEPAQAAKNVILMIADGSGYNTWRATDMYQGKLGKQIYDQPGWHRFSAATYPLNFLPKPTGNATQTPLLVYDPVKAWDAAVLDGKPGNFAGYFYLQNTATDSAAAATAMATGRKTYNNAINWSNEGQPLRGQTIAEIAKTHGKSVGVVTSVPWSHATPAGLGGAHNESRNHYAQIANEMLDAHWLDVILGAGNPDFDDDGQPLSEKKKRDFHYVGGPETWAALKSGRRDWTLIEKKADFEKLATGPTPPKLLGTAQVGSTLQEKRGCGRVTLPYDKVTTEPSPQEQARLPFTVTLNRNVPSLAVMTTAALNCLDDNPRGFYLMIEGGAIDWANHAHEPDRMIEEQIDFLVALEAVAAWIDTHGGWENTLLILTADHETGLLWGPESRQIAFQPLQDRGPGKMPGMQYNSHGHSNSLVPLFVRGPGSRRFAKIAHDRDPAAHAHRDPAAAANWNTSDQYLNNIDIFAVMRAEVTETKD
jgi:alkaline phosphatase